MHAATDRSDVVDSDRSLYLFPISSRIKGGERSKKRYFAVRCHTCGDRGEILFCNSHLYETLGESFPKMVGVGTFGEIGSENDNAAVGLASFNDALAKTLARRGHVGFFKNIFCELCLRIDHPCLVNGSGAAGAPSSSRGAVDNT